MLHPTCVLYLFYLPYCTIPPHCISLGLVSGNRQFNHELTPYQRGIAIGMNFKNAKSSEIQVALDCSRGALRSTLKFAHLRNEGQSQTWISAPKSYTNANECNLLRHIWKNLKDSYTMVRKACRIECSESTIKRILWNMEFIIGELEDNQFSQKRIWLKD